MGIASGDIYGDGGESIIVTNLPTEAFTLFQRQPNGDFVDATEQSGLSHISLPYTGFGVGLFDMTNSGLLDMFSANGGVRAMAGDLSSNPKGDSFPYRERKLLLRNMGKGKGFEDITAMAGPALASFEVSRSAAFGDVNNDGGTDILVTNNNGPARLLLNTVRNLGHWLLVHLEGTKTNRSAYGSVVELVRMDGTSVKRLGEGRWQLSGGERPPGSFRSGEGPAIESHPGLLAGGGMRVLETDSRRHHRESQGRHGAPVLGSAIQFGSLIYSSTLKTVPVIPAGGNRVIACSAIACARPGSFRSPMLRRKRQFRPRSDSLHTHITPNASAFVILFAPFCPRCRKLSRDSSSSARSRHPCPHKQN